MTPNDESEGRLDLEVQRLLGAALRHEYRDLVTQLPERFVRLLLPLHELGSRSRSGQSQHITPALAVLFDGYNFDPPTIAILTESLEAGWETLQSIGNTTISRDALARCLLELARTGERSVGRLSTTALVRLLMQPPADDAGQVAERDGKR